MTHAGQFGGITLHDACADGDVEKARKRLENTMTQVNKKDVHTGETALVEAARWGHTNVITLLLE